VLAWGFDAYDVNEFNDRVNPATLQVLASAAERAYEVNGAFSVVVGTPACRT
jgi:hypothetical protein